MMRKDKELPLPNIEDIDEQSTELENNQLVEAEEEELNYRNYPHLDIF
jgi:hypothetical protein